MAVNFSYFRRHTTKRRWRNLAVFVITKAQQLNRTPYQVLSELSALVKSENMLIDDSLLIVLDGGKNCLYGDNSLVDLVSHTGVPRFTHRIAV